MEPDQKQAERLKKYPWLRLPTWARWTLGGVIALLVISISYGAGTATSEVGELKEETDQQSTQIAQLTDERDLAEEEAGDVLARKERILSDAKASAGQIVGKARTEHAKLAADQEELAAVQDELSEAEAALTGAEHDAELTSFGDGIWQAETDFLPGTYRTGGGTTCYWAKLNSTDTFDIADNNNGTGQQVVTLDTPYFQTEGCGTWERIGE
jgi:hypothetical protein